MKFCYAAPSALEAERFSFISWDYEVVPYDRAWKFIPSFIHLLAADVVVVNGFRHVDRAIVILAALLNKRVIVLQHGVNANAKLKNVGLVVKKLTSSTFKYTNWAICIAAICLTIIFGAPLARIFSRGRTLNAIAIYSFTASYGEQWELFVRKFSLKAEIIVSKAPPVTVWGTITQIPQAGSVKAFLIDEPLDETIGVSDKKFQQALIRLCKQKNIDVLHVKVHPRSRVEKYSSGEFVSVDWIPENCEYLIGYQSNLLRAFAKTDYGTFLQVQVDKSGNVNFRCDKNINFNIEPCEDAIDYSSIFI